ncbi:MAG: hypothetical protein WCJ58_04370 [bacterium]
MKNKKQTTIKRQFVTKRSDTKISSIEREYKVNLGVRSDMKLGNYLKRKGYPSLAAMLKTR